MRRSSPTDVLERLELSTVDTRFVLRGEQPVPRRPGRRRDRRQDVRRVRRALAVLAQPLRRGARAGLGGEPAVIVYDVQFTEPSDDPRADNRLIEASRAAGNVVFSTTETGERGESNVFGGGEALAYARAASGNGLFPEDPGGVFRRAAARRSTGSTRSRSRRSSGSGRPVPSSAWAATARGSTSSARRGHVRARVVLRRRAGRGRRPSASATRSSSSARPRRCCRTPTRSPGPATRWPGRRSTRTRSTRCCAARRCGRPARATTWRSRSRSRCSRRCSRSCTRPWTGC